MLAEEVPDARERIWAAMLAMVRQSDESFVLLATSAICWHWNLASAEEIQDHHVIFCVNPTNLVLIPHACPPYSC